MIYKAEFNRVRDRNMFESMSSVRQIIVIVTVAIALEGTKAKSPSRVVGGEDGEIGEFPYTAALMKKNRQMCGGTIIGKRHILTAAHCISGVSEDPSKEMRVVTGTNSIAIGAGISHAIKLVTVHPDYSDKSEDLWRNDIAVITLTRDIAFDIFSKPILLPEEDTPSNWKCIASGWGVMGYPRGINPNNVRKANMTTLSNAKCRKSQTILDTHLCAYASLGIGLCSGDSGGPLVHDGTIVGIASFVVPCAKGIPDVFTRVYSYLGFIREAMAKT